MGRAGLFQAESLRKASPWLEVDLDMSSRSEHTGEAANISDWIVNEGLSGATQAALLEGFCERLVTACIPLQRALVAQRALHPIFGAVGFNWHRQGNYERQEKYAHPSAPLDQWVKSPFYYMLDNGTSEFRERLLDGNEPSQFEVLEEFRAEGATDYFASAMLFGKATIGPDTDPNDPPEGMISSWTSDAPSGFSDSDINAIRGLLPVLGLALKSASIHRTARDLLTVYLGRDAGRRVLSGDLQRGSFDTIRAVIWYFDLQGFTKLAETTPGSQMIEMLDDYFDAVVRAVEAHGGDVLKFMGDGLLAIFKFEDDDTACCSAVDAADELLGSVTAINDSRRTKALPLTGFSLALHLGEVMYGNIGAENRLDFTVVGPAVNMSARIEEMCRPLEQDIIISSAVAESSVRKRKRIVSIGRYVLRGVPEPQELFTLVAPKYADE